MKTVMPNKDIVHLFAQFPRREQHHARNPGSTYSFDSYAIDSQQHPLKPKGEMLRNIPRGLGYGTENLPSRTENIGDHVSKLFSYRTCITMLGQREGNLYALITTQTYSMTTTCKHMPRGAISSEFAEFRVHDCEAFTDEEHRANVIESVEEAGQVAKKIKRARTNGQYYKDQSNRILARARSYADFFGVNVSDILPEGINWASVAERIEEQEKIEKAAREKAAKKQQKQDAIHLKEWRDGERGNCPHSYGQYASGTSRLRVSPGGVHVESSEQARITVPEACRALDLIERLRKREGGKSVDLAESDFKIGEHYRLDKIKSDGRIHIGCHSIEWAEIERIAPQLRKLSRGETC